MTLVKLDKSPEATGELESPWCAGENPGVSPRDFDQRTCRMIDRPAHPGRVQDLPGRLCEAHGMASDAHAASAAHDAIDA